MDISSLSVCKNQIEFAERHVYMKNTCIVSKAHTINYNMIAGGACGYSGSDIAKLYSTRTAALSTPMFSDGDGCGRCYEIRCAKSKWCTKGSPSITITGTNLCPPNWSIRSTFLLFVHAIWQLAGADC
jgi:hypothetical protein